MSDYLDKMECTRAVWISEDETPIITKVIYDPATNQLVGLTLPLDSDTGCPKTCVFSATDAETIKSLLEEERSNYLYLVMAQPLDEKIPPFVLQLFGTSNKFGTQDVIKRWKFTKKMLEKYTKIVFTNSLFKLQLIYFFQIRHRNKRILHRRRSENVVIHVLPNC